MDKTKVSGIKTARICSHHEKAVLRHRAVKVKRRQGMACAVLDQGPAQKCMAAEKLSPVILCQHVSGSAAHFFQQAVVILVESLADKARLLMPKYQVVALFDLLKILRNQEKDPMI